MPFSIHRDTLARSVIFVVVAAALIVVLWPTFQAPGQPEDEGIALVHPELLLKGLLPYRDFERIYGPGNMLILSAAYPIFGINIFVERAVGLGYRLLILLSIFGIAKRWGTLITTACALGALVVLGNGDVWANTWMAASAFSLCAFWMMANLESRRRCCAGGVLAGIALLCRCDFGVALALSILPLFLSMGRAGKMSFLAGIVAGLLPLFWLAVVVGPIQLFDKLFLLPVFRLSSGGFLPMAAASPGVLTVFCVYLVASTINVITGLFALRNTEGHNPLLLAVSIFGFALIHYALSRFDSGHVFNSALVSFLFLPASISVLFSFVAKPLPQSVGIAIVITLALSALQLLRMVPHEKGVFVQQNGRKFPVAARQAPEAAQATLSELERVSVPGQRLFVGPRDLRRTVYCDTWIYHLFPQLTPASYFLEMNPGSANAPGSRLAGDVASADWLILNRAWDDIFEPNRSSEYGPDEPNNVVQADFDLWAKYRPYFIFRNRRLRNFLVPPPTPPGGEISRRGKYLSVPPLLRRPKTLCRSYGRIRLIPRDLFQFYPHTQLGIETPR